MREAVRGNGPVDKTGTAPRADFTTHRSGKMRAFTDARGGWLTVIRLPGYAPDLNAVEGAWSVMKSGLGNHAAATLDQLEAIVRSRLRTIQRRPRPHQRTPRTDGPHARPTTAIRPWPFNLCKPADTSPTWRTS